MTTLIDPGDRWQCQTCGRLHPVPSLARDCEQRHRDDHHSQEDDHHAAS